MTLLSISLIPVDMAAIVSITVYQDLCLTLYFPTAACTRVPILTEFLKCIVLLTLPVTCIGFMQESKWPSTLKTKSRRELHELTY